MRREGRGRGERGGREGGGEREGEGARGRERDNDCIAGSDAYKEGLKQ